MSFWEETWQKGQIGFHQGRPNEYLEKFKAHLEAATGVLVPLCGKSEDLTLLGERHAVVGVELSELAVSAYFAEHGLDPQKKSAGALESFSAGAITILCGDFFAVETQHVTGCNGFYDRAALVALPPEIRERYVQHLRKLLPKGATGLLVTLEYAPGRLEGPPWSTPPAEVERLFAGCEIELLESGPATTGKAATAEATERCYRIVL